MLWNVNSGSAVRPFSACDELCTTARYKLVPAIGITKKEPVSKVPVGKPLH